MDKSDKELAVIAATAYLQSWNSLHQYDRTVEPMDSKAFAKSIEYFYKIIRKLDKSEQP